MRKVLSIFSLVIGFALATSCVQDPKQVETQPSALVLAGVIVDAELDDLLTNASPCGGFAGEPVPSDDPRVSPAAELALTPVQTQCSMYRCGYCCPMGNGGMCCCRMWNCGCQVP